MRLEKKKDEELAARKGMTGKTIVALIWFIISGIAAYFLITYLIDQDYLSLSIFYQMGIPRSVPDWVFFAFLILIVIIFMQFFLLFGFIIASPEGRRHTGDPSLHSRSKDPFDNFGGRG
jgi:hypothetical protein